MECILCTDAFLYYLTQSVLKLILQKSTPSQIRPLILCYYLFRLALLQIRSGGAVINDCLMGETQTELPFGGVGAFRVRAKRKQFETS